MLLLITDSIPNYQIRFPYVYLTFPTKRQRAIGKAKKQRVRSKGAGQKASQEVKSMKQKARG